MAVTGFLQFDLLRDCVHLPHACTPSIEVETGKFVFLEKFIGFKTTTNAI